MQIKYDDINTEQGQTIVNKIGADDIKKAVSILQEYKDAKSNLEQRIKEDEEWYKLQHWSYLRKEKQIDNPLPTSGWLFNAINSKHADMMDNYPEPNVLPRERSDEEQANILSKILPVIFERNNFDEIYSNNNYDKIKDGTSVYGIFWDKTLDDGLGDIKITSIDLLNIFWQPGIDDIQQSRNLFICSLVDNDVIESQYPEVAGKLTKGTIQIEQYCYEDNVDTSNKSLIVDWYYKVNIDGKNIVHLCKFVGDTILYSSANEEDTALTGLYQHGMYPIVFDIMYPEKGTPCGFGLIASAKDPQMYIDKLSGVALENAMLSTKPRFLCRKGSGLNKDQLADFNNQMIECEGSVNEDYIRQIIVGQIPSNTLNLLNEKINELKETTANRDFNNGGTSGGVTAASAISALQEVGNKTSRDIISGTYRCYRNICYMAIELIRQFYTLPKTFRIITANNNQVDYVNFSNENIVTQQMGVDINNNPIFRKPIFDIIIKAQRQNPFSKASQNQLAIDLYNMKFFNPENAQASLIALDMMEFEGKDKIIDMVSQGQTLLNIVQQLMGAIDNGNGGNTTNDINQNNG